MSRAILFLPHDLPPVEAFRAEGLQAVPVSAQARLPAWLRDVPCTGPVMATPVRLTVGVERLFLHRVPTGGEEPALRETLAEGLGIGLVDWSALGWRVSAPELPALSAVPLPALEGRGLTPYLPAGEDGRPWRRLMNEAQVLMHAQRGSVGEVEDGEANGLWFWCLPEDGAGPRKVLGDDPVAVALGARPLLDAGAWLAQGMAGDEVLLVPAPCPQTDFEQRWLRPLLAALDEGRLACLTLLRPEGEGLELTRRRRAWWRFWAR